MNTTQLECFLEVANCLNFSRAAERLRITQPAVSHQINALEDELGVKLFYRTSKTVRLTQEGFGFTQYAGEILKLTRLSKARMTESQLGAPRRLVIGCRNTAETRFLVPALERLRTQQPDVLPVLRLIPFDSVENQLTEGDIHMIFSFRDSAPPKARFRELTRCPVVCICNPDHPLAKFDHLTVRQLQAAGRIATCRPPICPPALFTIQSQVVGSRETAQILFCDNHEILYPLVQAGYAFAILADLPNTRLPGLRYIPLPEFDPLSFGAVYLPGTDKPFLQALLRLLKSDAPDRPKNVEIFDSPGKE
ncbi:MAG TPA: LysR family transcriptional regulator [Candidatus Pullichristensenella excrementigallinarum]|uniref:LysR family transcriptional regulator n=1 Tax=Candidatus Pullichristensenella excrementigallinarum TaxID=2840907 RepID=A0A9D1LBP7_9FIRM|nr:LysR family transcriptional regulator [Candidatus Pullichristensenella excrementigallinarum]